MQILKPLGAFANGWTKLIVILIAIGWTAIHLADRVLATLMGMDIHAAQEIDVAHGTMSDNTQLPVGSELAPAPAGAATDDPATISHSVYEGVKKLDSRIQDWLSETNSYLPLSVCLIAGFGLGLVSRPLADKLVYRRRVRAALRRQSIRIQDERILAYESKRPRLSTAKGIAIRPHWARSLEDETESIPRIGSTSLAI
jgi:hypothetical protein